MITLLRGRGRLAAVLGVHHESVARVLTLRDGGQYEALPVSVRVIEFVLVLE